MTLILNGTDNSATVPAVQGGTAGTSTGLYYPTTSAVGISTAGTNAVYIDASQNVGIGTSTPAPQGATSKSKLTLAKSAQSTIGESSYLHLGGSEAGVGTHELISFGYNSSGLTNFPAYIGYENTNLSANTKGDLIFGTRDVGTDTAPSERMRISSAGNVGIGTNSPVAVSSYTSTTINGTTGGLLYFQHGGTTNSQFAGTSTFTSITSTIATPIIFNPNNTEAARIDSSGNVLVGATAANYSGSGFTLSKDSGTTKWLCGPNAGNPTQFIISAATSLGVYLTSTSALSWSSASDERLKDIIEPIADGIEKVCTLRSVIGTYKNDPEKNRRPFLIAQDLQKVFPEAVDASDPDRLGVQYTEVIPLLVAAIKEQQALITSLTARIEALEAR